MRQAVAALSIVLTLANARGPAAAAAPTAAELDTLLAPIALYPDQLLGEMLVSAEKPTMVGALAEWLRSQTLRGSELQDAVVKAGFDYSFATLVLFPDVLEWMAGRPDWTKKVGEAFTADRSSVFDSVQRLRAKAKGAGTLKDTPQQQVESKTTSAGQEVIVIEPANPQIVYVPQYNPQVVYTQPSTTIVVQEHHDDAAAAAAGAMIGFTAGVAIGAAFDNNYYYGPHGWGGGYMYNDGWDDWNDARDDARDDWQDHREDMYENRSDRAEDARENRSDRAENAGDQRSERTQGTQQQRTDRQAGSEQRATRQESRSGAAASPSAASTSSESRGFSQDGSTVDRSGTRSDAFSGYSSGKSERAASQRGERSRSSSRSSGSRRR
ncbi:MAG TPA: DUF3300 domain-containing protein [Vicinamibacterales bacterium]|jgi:hypothetical protein